jgi:hypothetical protein
MRVQQVFGGGDGEQQESSHDNGKEMPVRDAEMLRKQAEENGLPMYGVKDWDSVPKATIDDLIPGDGIMDKLEVRPVHTPP